MSGFSSSKAPWLCLHDVTVMRGGRLVLDRIGLSLSPGEALLLTGPNGSGKSTLLRFIAGLCPAQGGTICMAETERSAEKREPDLALDLAYLGHQDALKPGLSLRENLSLEARLCSGENPEAALEDAFAQLDLALLADLPSRLLSAGQKRRGALARVLLRRAPLWLLDEPSLGLDDRSIGQLGEIMARHRAAGGMIIATTHIPLPLPDARKLDLTPPDDPSCEGVSESAAVETLW